MKNIFKNIIWIFGLIFAIQLASADSFVVKQIKVVGLQRVQESTVLSYIPVHIGQTITTEDTINILKSLYKTGFFTNASLSRQGDTLVIKVSERPTIGLILVEGNKEFTDKQLFPVLKDLGVVEGSTYDVSKINAITQGLLDQYHELGYYAAEVKTVATPEPRNRVAIKIYVKEGPIAKIRHIQFIGNHVFTQKQLVHTFTSRVTSWWRFTFLTNNDRYSKTQLAKDLDQLREFYFNHGYLRFEVVNQNVVISPDNKSVDILITVSEGPVYTLSGFDIQGSSAPYAASYAADYTYLNKNILLKSGKVFSRQTMLNTSEMIRVYFASKGHAFPVINADPRLDDAKREVFIVFDVNPGPISYVRNIEISGNPRTDDRALRNRITQMESAPYSLIDVEQSKARMAYLPYISNVSVDTIPVPGIPDQVDLNYRIKEVSAGKASIQGGYSTSDGWVYGASLTEPNLLGTGKYGALQFSASDFQKSYSLSYVDPYYTWYGISRGITIFSNITTPSTNLNYASYSMDGYGAAVTYGIPVSLNNRINLGYGYTYIVLHDVHGNFTSPTITDFVKDHPGPYNQFKLTASWAYSTLNRAVAPTTGFSQLLGLELGVPIIKSSLGYYKITEEVRYFRPLGFGFIFNPHASIGFGGGYGNINTLPFFYNFYAGGIETLPGFAPNSLGPQNPLQKGAALGGNLRLLGGANLILPTIFTEKVRTALTFNAGNVWETDHIAGGNQPNQVFYEDISLNNVRMSAGILVIWYSPLGPLQFSVAQAINSKSRDQLDMFGFIMGASI